MATPHKCPVCNGEPKIVAGFDLMCTTCKGSGIVWDGPVMRRYPFENIKSGGGYVQCTCGSVLQSVAACRDHWERGHFDVLENP